LLATVRELREFKRIFWNRELRELHGGVAGVSPAEGSGVRGSRPCWGFGGTEPPKGDFKVGPAPLGEGETSPPCTPCAYLQKNGIFFSM